MYYNTGAEIVIHVDRADNDPTSVINNWPFRGLIAIATTTEDNEGENSEGG